MVSFVFAKRRLLTQIVQEVRFQKFHDIKNIPLIRIILSIGIAHATSGLIECTSSSVIKKGLVILTIIFLYFSPSPLHFDYPHI